jgi:hypothetical protein
MSLQRVSASVPLADATTVPESFVPIFHDWIQREAVEGLLIDVARYGHVHHGPGVMLIGHEGDYSVDMAGGRPHLRYTLKREAEGSPTELVALAVRRLAGACVEVGASPGTSVAQDELVITVADRLHAPNTDETWEWLRDAIATGVSEALGTVDVTVTPRQADAREPASAMVAVPSGMVARNPSQ